jgi:hypothetical protein
VEGEGGRTDGQPAARAARTPILIGIRAALVFGIHPYAVFIIICGVCNIFVDNCRRICMVIEMYLSSTVGLF